MNELENIKLTFQTLQDNVLKMIHLSEVKIYYFQDFNSLYWNTAKFPLALDKKDKNFPKHVVRKNV